MGTVAIKILLESSNLFELYELLHRHAENIYSAVLQDQVGQKIPAARSDPSRLQEVIHQTPIVYGCNGISPK